MIETTFQNFLKHPNIAVILVTQFVAENYLRHIINSYDAILPTILEIPSKEYPYEAKKVFINKLLYRILSYKEHIDFYMVQIFNEIYIINKKGIKYKYNLIVIYFNMNTTFKAQLSFG